jgi:hypothetical protein
MNKIKTNQLYHKIQLLKRSGKFYKSSDGFSKFWNLQGEKGETPVLRSTGGVQAEYNEVQAE